LNHLGSKYPDKKQRRDPQVFLKSRENKMSFHRAILRELNREDIKDTEELKEQGSRKNS